MDSLTKNRKNPRPGRALRVPSSAVLEVMRSAEPWGAKDRHRDSGSRAFGPGGFNVGNVLMPTSAHLLFPAPMQSTFAMRMWS